MAEGRALDRPSDAIIVSGGGSVAVASDALFADAQALEGVYDELRRAAAGLAAADTALGDRLLRRADAPLSALDAEREIARSLELVAASGQRASALAFVLRASAHSYGLADDAAARLAQQLAAGLGYSIGRLLPLAVALIAPALPSVLGALLVASLIAPKQVAALPGALGTWLADNNRLLTNPVTVALVRAAVMSVDDVIGGALGLPRAAVQALGDEGAGVAGIDTSAGFFTVVGAPFGLLVETAVATRAAGRRDIRAPQGLAERLDRVPQRVETAAGARGQHIRIERYESPGRPDRFAVYITGTADFSPRTGPEAFDLTSNVVGMTELPAGSVRAVHDAMRQEGVTPDSPVQFTGFSQGGLVAATLAASGDYNTQGVVTVGAPTAQVSFGNDYPAVLLEHTDDIVPALGGNRIDDDPVLVQREAFAGRETPTGVAVPSHDREEYRRTAELADGARSEHLVDAIAELDDFGRGATTVTSTTYVAERVRR
ncbi:hypothetical protein GCM10027413_02260 [Conyzicola nivalis]|uniref:Alpha/Beta hydrolase protein n=1 Tax=Conyzicola nivalis TaxID=1477021 RepID=A0A916SN11_9MICO|nr:hypothetical protein [Conyzicola nivalis]GGB08953.1 hypothetical protein GCM10010979_24380 [Conyzicola nivalis]